MATSKIKGLDEQLLEGGGGGGGMGRGSSISGTKWSNVPSRSSSTIGDLKKLTADTSNLKGGAKAAVEEAKARAAKRTGVRALGAATIGAGVKSMMPESASAKDSGGKSEPIEARFRNIEEESPEAGEMSTHYKKGGMVASRRADGIAQRGKTRGKIY